jgi:hypothetical protein
MNKYYYYISKINIVLAMVGLFLLGSNTLAQGQSSAGKTDPYAPQFLTNAPPPGFATREDYLKSFTSEKDILDAYHAGLINKDESMLAMGALEDKEEDKALMDTYGKVVDQDGQPVAGVKVLGRLELGIGEYKDCHAETDSQGLFQFLGSHGSGLILHFQKQGYDFDGNLLPERPKNYLPDPNNPLNITMWKLRGAEPMKHIQIQSPVLYNGDGKRFDLLTSKTETLWNVDEIKSAKQSVTGELTVTVTRELLNPSRGQPFNWSLILAVTNGGLCEASNTYPYEAPSEGYRPIITLSFPTNMVGWQSKFNGNYYFKSQGGRVYGRMAIQLSAGRSFSLFTADIYANPAGSRNLEFDHNKQIH